MSINMDGVLYLAYQTPDVQGRGRFDSKGAYMKVEDFSVLPFPKDSYPSLHDTFTERFTKLYNEMPLTTEFRVTRYGVNGDLEAIGVVGDARAGIGQDNYSRITCGSVPVDVSNLDDVHMAKISGFGPKADRLVSTSGLSSVRLPKGIPSTIRGVLSVRMKLPDGKESWVPAETFVKEYQGYKLHVLDGGNEYPRIEHVNSRKEAEEWCADYFKNVLAKDSLNGKVKIECVGDVTSTLRGVDPYKHKDFYYDADVRGVTKNGRDFASWTDLHKLFGESIGFSDGMSKNGARAESEQGYCVAVRELGGPFYNCGPLQDFGKCLADIKNNRDCVDSMLRNIPVEIRNSNDVTMVSCTISDDNQLEVRFPNDVYTDKFDRQMSEYIQQAKDSARINEYKEPQSPQRNAQAFFKDEDSR